MRFPLGAAMGPGPLRRFRRRRAFTPASLFASGEQGGWWDFADAATLFEDSAGATQATLNGPVGRISDKSGRGNHLVQAATASKPILRDGGGTRFAEFDGIDDVLASLATLNLSGTDKATIILGLRKTSAVTGMVAELGSSFVGTPGGFYSVAGQDASNYGYSAASRGTAAAVARHSAPFSQPNNPDDCVITVAHDIAGDLTTLQRNGAGLVSGTADKGAGNLANDTLFVGARAGSSLFFPGRLYGLLVVGRLLSAAERADAEAWMAARSGVTF